VRRDRNAIVSAPCEARLARPAARPTRSAVRSPLHQGKARLTAVTSEKVEGRGRTYRSEEESPQKLTNETRKETF
jgi:hypothetical protein